MELMVDRIGKLSMQERLMFVVASDDSSWCRDKFSQFKLNYTIVYTVDHFPMVQQRYLDTHNLSRCSNGDCNDAIEMEYVHFDLAVLSSMNYNIFDYGTFGLWGAYLSQSEITIGLDLKVRRKYLVKDRVIEGGVEGFLWLPTP